MQGSLSLRALRAGEGEAKKLSVDAGREASKGLVEPAVHPLFSLSLTDNGCTVSLLPNPPSTEATTSSAVGELRFLATSARSTEPLYKGAVAPCKATLCTGALKLPGGPIARSINFAPLEPPKSKLMPRPSSSGCLLARSAEARQSASMASLISAKPSMIGLSLHCSDRRAMSWAAVSPLRASDDAAVSFISISKRKPAARARIAQRVWSHSFGGKRRRSLPKRQNSSPAASTILMQSGGLRRLYSWAARCPREFSGQTFPDPVTNGFAQPPLKRCSLSGDHSRGPSVTAVTL